MEFLQAFPIAIIDEASIGGTVQPAGIPASVVMKFLSQRRVEVAKTELYSFLVLFSMGIAKRKWSALLTELLNFKMGRTAAVMVVPSPPDRIATVITQ